MKQIFWVVTLLAAFVAANGVGMAADYNFIGQDEMKAKIENGQPILIVDIQEKPGYEKHHFPGSVATYAYPVKSDEEKSRLDIAVAAYEATGNQVVIVCPRGKGGAKRCYDYLKSKSVPEDKLMILEKGSEGWPYVEMFVSGDR